ncbi:MAG: adenosylcobalamin-dependent ribonucleoside-diphosphate reductase [Nitrospirota bacterium]|jgi:ribonucleoside-diphosphate reductase alpha chain
MELSENALKTLQARYLIKNEKGEVTETPDEMFWRVARAVASSEALNDGDTEEWARKFHGLMSSLCFLPNSPTLMNAGKRLGQLAACFVLPVEDSMESIFGTLRNAAMILQSGGGTGFSFSHLRPRHDVVRSTGGIASGPVSFMKIYNTATDVIKQGGARRGANMGILRVDHPDIMDFITLKRDEHELTNFNISVAATDAFIEAVKKDEEYGLVNPRSGRTEKRVRAREVFDELVKSAWMTGDPGMVFLDRINEANPTPQVGRIESTNPCGEQPLLPNEACVLGSIDLSKCVQKGDIQWDALRDAVRTGVRFLDDAIDANRYPIAEIEAMHKGNRKIGLGVMGWADMLVLLGMRYDSPPAFELAEEVMKFIKEVSHGASSELAETRGVFPNFTGSVYDRPDGPKMRNATVTTIAPTGTLSTIADCSSSIEPLFAIAYKRYVLDTVLYEANKHFFRIARERGFYSESLKKKVAEAETLGEVPGVPEDVREIFVTAHEISPEDHIRMQAAFQKYTDNAVSKTVNVPGDATVEDVKRAYLLAYDLGCKGITVFRYGTEKRGTLIRMMDTD